MEIERLNVSYSGPDLRGYRRNKYTVDAYTTWILKNLKLWRVRGQRGGIRSKAQGGFRSGSLKLHGRRTFTNNNEPKRRQFLRKICCSPMNYLPSVIVTNARSLNNKMEQLEILLKHQDVQIGVISETWFDEFSVEGAQIEGYIDLHKIRNNGKIRGGGVSVYISDSLKVIDSEVIEDLFFEAIVVTCRPSRLPRGLNAITIIGVYFPPGNTVEQQSLFESKLLQIIDMVRSKYSNIGILLCGDFNGFKRAGFVNKSGLYQMVDAPTRGNSLLDLVFTDLRDWYSPPVCSEPLGDSDHLVVFMRGIGWVKGSIKITRWIRKTPSSRKIVFGQDMTSSYWEPIDFYKNDINLSLDKFYNVIIDKYHCAFPSVKVTTEEKKEWINDKILVLIKGRSNAFKKKDMVLVKKLNLLVKKEIVIAKKVYARTKFGKLEYFSADYYKFLSGLFMSRRTDINLSDVEEKDLPNVLNSFFNSCWTTHARLDLENCHCFLPSVPPILFSISEVYKGMMGIKLRSSIGPSSIPNWVWKEFAVELAPVVTYLFNESISKGIFPDRWKIAIIVPVPKVTVPKSVSDFRPISLTDPLSKILERLIYNRLMRIMEPYIDYRQFGGVAKRSTSHYVFNLLEWKHGAVETPRSRALVCFIDFSKAYDLVDHNVVIGILIKLDIPGYLISWLCSFLVDRNHKVCIGNLASNSLITSCGVPQGTLIGGLLFIILVNQIADSIPNRWKYIDDLTIGFEIKGTNDSVLERAINDIEQSSMLLGMQLNYKKTKVMQISFSKIIHIPEILVGDKIIPQVEDIVILGIVLQNNLKWDLHVDSIVKKASKRFYIIYKLRRYGCCTDTLVRAYCTYIRPLLEYGVVVWHGGLTIKQEKVIESIQARILRIVLGDRFSSYREALELLNLCSLKVRREQAIIKIGRGILQDIGLRYMLPGYRTDAYSYGLRNSGHVSKIFCGSTRRLKSPGPTMIRLLNNSSG